MPEKSERWSIKLQMIILIIFALVGYHFIIKNNMTQTKIYTTNARTVIENLYQKALRGEIDQKLFESILRNMENQLRSELKENLQAVVLVQNAVVMGAESIVFDQGGIIIKDPEKIKEAITAEKKVPENRRDTAEKQFDNAMREFRDALEKQFNGKQPAAKP